MYKLDSKRIVSVSASPGHNGVPQDPLSALEMTRLALWKMYNQAGGAAGIPGGLPGLPGLPGDLMGMGGHNHQDKFAEHRQRMFEAAQAARDESDNEDKCDEVDIADPKDGTASDKDTDDERLARRRPALPQTPPEIRASRAEILDGEEDPEDELEEEDIVEDVRRLNGDAVVVGPVEFSSNSSPSAKKRRRSDDDAEEDPNLEMTSPRKVTSMGLGIPGANIKISSRGIFFNRSPLSHEWVP